MPAARGAGTHQPVPPGGLLPLTRLCWDQQPVHSSDRVFIYKFSHWRLNILPPPSRDHQRQSIPLFPLSFLLATTWQNVGRHLSILAADGTREDRQWRQTDTARYNTVNTQCTMHDITHNVTGDVWRMLGRVLGATWMNGPQQSRSINGQLSSRWKYTIRLPAEGAVNLKVFLGNKIHFNS